MNQHSQDALLYLKLFLSFGKEAMRISKLFLKVFMKVECVFNVPADLAYMCTQLPVHR